MSPRGWLPRVSYAAAALLVAFGARLAWWSEEFDPLMLFMYGIFVLGMAGIVVLYGEAAQRRGHGRE